MLTKVILEGPMGKKFGKEWELDVESPSEALRLIEANKPGLFAWIKQNLEKYSEYNVVCEYEDGSIESLDDESYKLNRQCTVIRFVPVIKGAGSTFRVVLGIVLIIVGVFTTIFGDYSGSVIMLGVGLLASGVAQMLAPKPKMNDNSGSDGRGEGSYFFDGPANTSTQGVPVQLIYGRCLVGSHTISAAVSVDQLK